MSRLAWVVAVCCSAAIAATPSPGTTLTGTQSTVNAGPGDQFDPHASDTHVAYSSSAAGVDEIRYFDLVAGVDQAVPTALPGGGSAMDFLSDLSGRVVVLTRLVSGRSAVCTFDIGAGGPVEELDPQPNSQRTSPAIGGTTVAWVDYGIAGVPEIVVYDRTARAAMRLTNDTAYDRNPAVAESGDVVVWEKCANAASGCDVFQAVRGGAGWVVSQVTNTPESERDPSTNGVVVAYAVARTGAATRSDVYWKPVSGGAEQQLALPGEDRNPSVSGRLLAFEHTEPGSVTSDIHLYDLSTNVLYPVTSTPALSETLSDVSLSPSGRVRVVWSVVEADLNVYAFTYQLQIGSSCPSTPQPTHCSDTGARPLLATLDAVRDPGAPAVVSASFTAQAGNGLLCVDNGVGGSRATAGWVWLNGVAEVRPWQLQALDTIVQRSVWLEASNTVWARIAGAPGSAYRVRVYGADPCDASPAREDDEADLDARLRPGHHPPGGGGGVRRLTGHSLAVLGHGIHGWGGGASGARSGEEGLPQVGCASSGGGTWVVLAAVVMLSLGGASRPRPSRVRLRLRR